MVLRSIWEGHRGNLLFHVEQKPEGEVELDMFHVEQNLGALPNCKNHLGSIRERNRLQPLELWSELTENG
jgi:hypothetical protein